MAPKSHAASMQSECLQVAVIGPGRLGKACALSVLDDPRLSLAGVVERAGYPGFLRGRLEKAVRVTHVRDLPAVDVALVCVPALDVLGVAHDLLQARICVVECARLEGAALQAHYQQLDALAQRYRCKAMMGAGWDPGVLPIIHRFFQTLIPQGKEAVHRHSGVQMYHSPSVSHLPGVSQALVAEFSGRDNLPLRYVYVSLKPGASWDEVRQQIVSDPLYVGESTQVYLLNSLDDLETQDDQGLVLERMSYTHSDHVQASLLLEARFDVVQFAARAMVEAAHQVTSLKHGGSLYGGRPGGS